MVQFTAASEGDQSETTRLFPGHGAPTNPFLPLPAMEPGAGALGGQTPAVFSGSVLPDLPAATPTMDTLSPQTLVQLPGLPLVPTLSQNTQGPCWSPTGIADLPVFSSESTHRLMGGPMGFIYPDTSSPPLNIHQTGFEGSADQDSGAVDLASQNDNDTPNRFPLSSVQEAFCSEEREGLHSVPECAPNATNPFLSCQQNDVAASPSLVPSVVVFEALSPERVFEVVAVSEAEQSLIELTPAGRAGKLYLDGADNLQGYSSDSSSDVYMNSDYTDTITSVTSTSLLLGHHRGESHIKDTESKVSEEATREESSSSDVATVCYSNEAFADTSATQALISWSSGESLEDRTRAKEAHDSSEPKTVSWAESISETVSDISRPTSLSGTLIDLASCAPKDYDFCEVGEFNFTPDITLGPDRTTQAEVTLIDATEPRLNVEALVLQRLQDVKNISVDCMTGPVYESVTEPLDDAECPERRSWLQSTDSLHQYKLVKQGRRYTGDQSSRKRHNSSKSTTSGSWQEKSSFLDLTGVSVDNLGRACQKALSYVRTDMEFGSVMSLRDSNLKIASSLSLGGRKGSGPFAEEAEVAMLGKKGEPALESGRHTQNVLYMSFVITILLVSINATRNLQSSLNQEGGVGVICLSVYYAAYTVGSLFSPVLVQGLGVKVCVTGSLVLELLYVAANLHPTIFVMVPAALGGGFSLAVIWNAMSTYIVLLARGEADYRQLTYERVSDKYFGYFCLIYQSNLVIGNLIASLILTFAGGPKTEALLVPLINGTADFGNSTWNNPNSSSLPSFTWDNQNSSSLSAASINASDLTNIKKTAEVIGLAPAALVSREESLLNSTLTSTLEAAKDTHYHLCGSEFCHHYVVNKDESAVALHTVYLLFGIFMFLILAGIGVAVFMLEPLSPKIFSASSSPSKPGSPAALGKVMTALGNVRQQMVSLIKFCRNVKFLLLLPLMFYTVMQFSFVCSEVMMAFVTCPLGVWLVGYSMMAYGACCSISSYVTQALVPRTGRGFFIALATAVNIGLLVFMRVWQPRPDVIYPLFIITSLFGVADGIWNITANGLCGVMFPDHYEEAFTGLRVAQGLGGAFSMGYASFFCMAVKIYILMAVVLSVLLGYLGAEALIRRDAKRQPRPALHDNECV